MATRGFEICGELVNRRRRAYKCPPHPFPLGAEEEEEEGEEQELDQGSMEGLIPFVIHAIKKSRERRQYASLSDESSQGRSRGPRPDKEGPSRHRRTRSEFQQRPQGSDYQHGSGGCNAPSDLARRRGLAPSRSLRGGARLSSADSSGAMGASRGLVVAPP